jgi:ribosome-associated toxin RatA of RatAB toxin-antitoxin module
MKQLRGVASAEVRSPVEDCFALLVAIEGYPDWYPDVVRAAETLASGKDGLPTQAQVTLHVAHGPLTRDFEMLLALSTHRPSEVKLSRVARSGGGERFDVTWRLQGRGAASTRIEVELEAVLDVPRLIPLGNVGEAFAEGFVGAACRRLEFGA